MPNYVFRCKKCGDEETLSLPMGERDRPVGEPCWGAEAGNCDGTLKRVYSPYNVLGAGVGDVI